ncbi:MAG: chromate efflux transporter [Actinomycetota bacterium]
MTDPAPGAVAPVPPLRTVALEWGRIGCIGFGGPPAHITLLRELCVARRRWLTAEEFEDAIVACNLLPGPASTQLAIYCARRVRGRAGALVGGAAFIVPGLALILVLAAVFLSGTPPTYLRGAAAGASAAVAAVAVDAGSRLVPASWRRGRDSSRLLWITYVGAGAIATVALGPGLVFVLLGCGGVQLAVWRSRRTGTGSMVFAPTMLVGSSVVAGGIASLVWVAFKVGALSYGGGFVIVPLLQADAVHRYHWMTNGQFLNAVALGQITPGPVVQTVAVVGYAAAGVGGGLLAALVAFSPSFLFIVIGARHFDRLRTNRQVGFFLEGAGPAAIGAILGSAIPLARALGEPWQYAVLAAAAVALLVVRRSVVFTLVAAAAVGTFLALLGVSLPR